MEGNYANVIIDISHEKVDRPFQYKIPDELRGILRVGACVTVPFGAGNHLRKGYVIEITDRAEFAPDKLKYIAFVQEKDLTAEDYYIRLAAWMKEQYGSTMIAALKTVLPVKQKIKKLEKKSCKLLLSPEEAKVLYEDCLKKHQVAKARVLASLMEEEELPVSLLTGKLHVSMPTLNSLEKQGAIQIMTENNYRNPMEFVEDSKDARSESYGEKKCLSDEQSVILNDIISGYDEGERRTCLIHGITGSGKTEVYLSLIEEIVKRGKQAIVLIPEIALTYQTVLRFYRCFGSRVSVINSTLSKGEKYDQCERAKKGDIDVIIGPRSALFTPFPNLGLIIIDEEHENTYKSESMPKYHARETAIEIASMHDGFVVLGSATPSLESYSRAKSGEYRLYELTKRQAGGELPTVYTVDLREELKEGNRSIFSRQLYGLMEKRLRAGEQIILFLNRRGYAGFISCRACGHVMKCPHCDVSLSEHKNGKLVCHYCGHEEISVKSCPTCGSKYMLGFRAGTQQIEEALHKEFPEAKVLRMDADTTRTKDSYEEILNHFANGEADILVGTQMIVKGHDFPNVTLVGILAADLSLHINDYRAGERTFQLLTQAAGRAGRSNKPGEVVIQTYDPEHYSIVHASKQDYQAFYEEEMLYRELLLYPPAAHMLAILVASPQEEAGSELAHIIGNLIKENANDVGHGTYLIGPAPASVSRVNDIYRFMLYIKNKEYSKLVDIKNILELYIEERRQQEEWRKEVVQFDFDPMNSY
ncbi:replication restart helicase PriA [Kineothrix sp. MB12-C1]|uniref:replication restart helicase PriA n=1 Tax=Kineothrix sp. MB12-C1 TaxID=3070215 RepID=UPI0027D217EE|nr:primosomal protein N' [Kineothrix sp. MB12-C1]WMC92212.1 primosomal protein N' [Kineothrix sp. MB12-C1]